MRWTQSPVIPWQGQLGPVEGPGSSLGRAEGQAPRAWVEPKLQPGTGVSEPGPGAGRGLHREHSTRGDQGRNIKDRDKRAGVGTQS